MELHGCRGCGSAAIEALLDLVGARYTRTVFDWDDRDAWERFRRVNPVGQVPALVLDDGTVVTESAAIALWIADRHPEAGLLPADVSARALAYRWTVWLATGVYIPVIVGDFPSRWVDGPAAQDDLKSHALQRVQDAWRLFEADIRPAPYLLGDRLSVVDVYAAMISRWRPGRAWIAAECPKATAAIERTERHPVVAAAWARNFD